MYKLKLSPYQKIFFNEWKISPGSSRYNIVFDQSLSSNLDLLRLQTALDRFVFEYVIFDSHVKIIDSEAYWVKNSTVIQLRHFSNQRDISKQILDYVTQPFDLESSQLYKFAVFQENNGIYRFIMVFHHILIDGSSFDEIVTEISKYYNSSTYSSIYSRASQIESIGSTTLKLHETLKQTSNQNKIFWASELSGIEPIDLRFIKNPIAADNTQKRTIKEICFSFDKDIISQLNQLKNNHNLSVYGFGQIIFAILLRQYTSQTKLAISYPISITEHLGLIYGASVNTNIVPYEIDSTTGVADLIMHASKFRSNLKSKGINHGYYSINDIIANTNKGNLDVAFAQTNFKDVEFSFNGVRVVKINNEFNIDLSCKLLFEHSAKQPLNYRVRYNAFELDEEILQQFIKHYKKLFLDVLLDLSNGVNNKLALKYPILDNSEYQQILYGWNNTYKDFPVNKTIHQLFEEQVAKTPDNIAVSCDSVKLTYKELNEKSNRLANYLRETYQIIGDNLIALYLDRSEHMLIAIIATLKSGAAYVPIDLSYPDERVKYILEDTQARVILTNEIYQEKLDSIVKTTICALDKLAFQTKIKTYSSGNLSSNITNKNLIYVIYTSGTTGKPKGVMIEHKSVVNYISNIKERIFYSAKEKVDFSTNLSFDLTVTTTIGALCSGYELCVYCDDARDVINYKKHLIDNEITIIKTVPSYFELLQDILLKTKITMIILGGESVSKSSMKKVCKDDLIVYDEYGPTETTVGTCISKIYTNGQLVNCLTIGIVYNNYKIYVFDTSMNPLPVGAIGELYIGGDGLARSYLNNKELTNAKFMVNPYQSSDDKIKNTNNRLYKTGDLVRYLPNGNLEYVGRNDRQIKIRGFRIELGEIENVLNSFEGIKQSVVINNLDKKNNDDSSESKYLIAYYVSDCKINELLLLNYLASQIPQYMIPTALINLDKIPLTINGKLDYQALPLPSITAQDNFVAPSNFAELKTCTFFEEVLNLPHGSVGVNHDFFKLGGNSILAINLLYKLQQEFKVTLNDIFKLKAPSRIAKLASFTKNSLYHRLKIMKMIYDRLDSYTITPEMEDKQSAYLKQIENISFKEKRKDIKFVLLTGSTGHLGCHILYQLLFETEYKIYLLIRATSNVEAYNRISNKFKFYFDISLDKYQDRIIPLASDIEKSDLNLNHAQYKALIANVDSIIHSAALVKHYGDYTTFYNANVQATINLLELSKLTGLKDFHYISTLSVLKNGYIPNSHYYLSTEDDTGTELKYSNVYVRTKREGTLAAIKYRQFGVNSNIYRVGNLAMNSKNYKSQENIEENAFFTKIKTIIDIGMIPNEISMAEVSPIDYTALAIIKLFDQAELSNQTYHIANPHECNLFELLAQHKSTKIKKVEFKEFIDKIVAQLDDKSVRSQIELFMLHQSWLEEINLDNLTRMIVLQDKTNFILNKFNFCWPDITSEMLSDVISKSELTKIFV